MQYQNHLSLRLGAIWHRENRQIVAATVDLIGDNSQLRTSDPQTIDRGSRFQSKSGNPGFPVKSGAMLTPRLTTFGLRARGAKETGAALLSPGGMQKDAIHICIAGGVGA